MSKKRKALVAILGLVAIGAVYESLRPIESHTVICMTLMGPKIVHNAEFSVSGSQISISAPDNPVKVTLPVGACMIFTEAQ